VERLGFRESGSVITSWLSGYSKMIACAEISTLSTLEGLLSMFFQVVLAIQCRPW
jgi:hypothetical protein